MKVIDSIAPSDMERLERLASVASERRRSLTDRYLATHPEQNDLPQEIKGKYFKESIMYALQGLPKKDLRETFSKIAAVLSRRKGLTTQREPSAPTAMQLAREAAAYLPEEADTLDMHEAVEKVLKMRNLSDPKMHTGLYVNILRELRDFIEGQEDEKMPGESSELVRVGTNYTEWPAMLYTRAHG